jgi:hypothetical protein
VDGTAGRHTHRDGATNVIRWGLRAASAVAASASLVAVMASAALAAGWVPHTTPAVPGAKASQLAAVSCPAPSVCTAVGGTTSAGGLEGSTLAERWNGTTWSLRATPNPAGAAQSDLRGVSCPISASCFAVGASATQFGALTSTLAERWDGTSWTLTGTPDPTGQSDTELQSVSCTSRSACTAVGFFADNSVMTASPVAERWNGKAWSLQSVPVPDIDLGAAAWLYGVSCSTGRSCIAVGYFNPQPGQSGFLVPFSERWNGSNWSVVRVPVPTATTSAQLTGVSCTAPHACIAVGASSTDGFSTSVRLAERWDGTAWSLQSVPNPGRASTPELTDVSCSTAATCSAVGTDFSTPAGLAARWNGGGWSAQAIAAHGITLSGVSCSTVLACVAVGHGTDSAGDAVTFAAGWTGSATTRIGRDRADRAKHRAHRRHASRAR